jgi:hypothetical protein
VAVLAVGLAGLYVFRRIWRRTGQS